jgi:hypothetical protein
MNVKVNPFIGIHQELVSSPFLNTNLNQDIYCLQCQNVILTSRDVAIELNGFFYHENCYKCFSCGIFFSLNDQSLCLPNQDKNGKLYCNQDFVW